MARDLGRWCRVVDIVFYLGVFFSSERGEVLANPSRVLRFSTCLVWGRRVLGKWGGGPRGVGRGGEWSQGKQMGSAAFERGGGEIRARERDWDWERANVRMSIQ